MTPYGKVEWKYLIPERSLEALRRRLAPYVDADLAAKKPGTFHYTVRSIYLDTPTLDYYDEKIEGYRVRRKLRVRAYNAYHNGSIGFLEIKRKHLDRISKSRAPIRVDCLDDVLVNGDIEAGAVTHLQEFPHAVRHARQFLFHVHRHSLRPVMLVTYDRDAFHGKFDSNLRITIDMSLRSALYPSLWELYREEGLRWVTPGYAIVEVKFFHNKPGWLKDIVSEFKLPRLALSKYAMAVTLFQRERGTHRFTKPAVLSFSEPITQGSFRA